MMPTCNYKGCGKIATTCLGQINTGRKDGYGKDWPETVYICLKHRKKILKMLGLKPCEENHSK